MNTLHTFFSWTLGTSLRASLLALVVLCLQAALRGRLSARSRYMLWLPVVFVLVMPVLPESRWSAEQLMVRNVQPAQVALASAAVEVELMPTAAIDAPTTNQVQLSASPTQIDWQQVSVVIWLIGVLSFLVGGVCSYGLVMHRIHRTAVTASDSLTAQVQSIGTTIRLRRTPVIRVSPGV